MSSCGVSLFFLSSTRLFRFCTGAPFLHQTWGKALFSVFLLNSLCICLKLHANQPTCASSVSWSPCQILCSQNLEGYSESVNALVFIAEVAAFSGPGCFFIAALEPESPRGT
jgi:hypothetical protein